MEHGARFLSTSELPDYSSHTQIENEVLSKQFILRAVLNAEVVDCYVQLNVMTTPVNASVFQTSWKSVGGLEADPICQSCQFYSLKAVLSLHFSFLFWCTKNCGAGGLFYTKNAISALMGSAGYLTGGFACFHCNMWQPSSSDSFNVQLFFQTQP